jgi:hypothetical protein
MSTRPAFLQHGGFPCGDPGQQGAQRVYIFGGHKGGVGGQFLSYAPDHRLVLPRRLLSGRQLLDVEQGVVH